MIIHDGFEQYSDEYWAIRNGLPTASVASKIVTSTGQPSKQMNDLAAQLAADKFAGHAVDSWAGNKFTENGTAKEPLARAYYQMMNDAAEITEVGFVTDNLLRIGASPDGIIDSPADGKGVLEIKNLTAKGHVKALLYYNKHGKPPTTYYPQVQMQMYVCEMDYCDLLYHHEELVSLIIRVRPDEKIFSALKLQINKCIALRDEYITMMEKLA